MINGLATVLGAAAVFFAGWFGRDAYIEWIFERDNGPALRELRDAYIAAAGQELVDEIRVWVYHRPYDWEIDGL